jgi:hypothetical protein
MVAGHAPYKIVWSIANRCGSNRRLTALRAAGWPDFSFGKDLTAMSAAGTTVFVRTTAGYALASIDHFYVNDINRQLPTSSQTVLGGLLMAAAAKDRRKKGVGICPGQGQWAAWPD